MVPKIQTKDLHSRFGNFDIISCSACGIFLELMASSEPQRNSCEPRRFSSTKGVIRGARKRGSTVRACRSCERGAGDRAACSGPGGGWAIPPALAGLNTLYLKLCIQACASVRVESTPLVPHPLGGQRPTFVLNERKQLRYRFGRAVPTSDSA